MLSLSRNENKIGHSFARGFLIALILTSSSASAYAEMETSAFRSSLVKIKKIYDDLMQGQSIADYGRDAISTAYSTGTFEPRAVNYDVLKSLAENVASAVDELVPYTSPELSIAPIPEDEALSLSRPKTRQFVHELTSHHLEAVRSQSELARLHRASARIRALSRALRDLETNVAQAIEDGATFIPLLGNHLPWLWFDLNQTANALNGSATDVDRFRDSADRAISDQMFKLRSAALSIDRRLNFEGDRAAELIIERDNLKIELEEEKQGLENLRYNNSTLELELEQLDRAVLQARGSLDSAQVRLTRARQRIRSLNAKIENYNRNMRGRYNLCPNEAVYSRCTHHDLKKQWTTQRNRWKRERRQARIDLKTQESIAHSETDRIPSLRRELELKTAARDQLSQVIDKVTNDLRDLEIVVANLEESFIAWVRETRIDVYQRGIENDRRAIGFFLSEG